MWSVATRTDRQTGRQAGRSSRLIALPKVNRDVRLIAIGETWRRVTARAICFQKRKEFADCFTPLQHRVSVEGGADLLVQ